MDGIPYADIIILALIAGFVALRLRSVLGQKTGNENPQFFKRPEEKKEADKEHVIHVSEKSLKGKPLEELDEEIKNIKNHYVVNTIADIKRIDPQFTATSFLKGAKMAYEMVFDAFEKGDKKTLEMLLEGSLYKTFEHEIDMREKSENKTETTLVSIQAKDIKDASLIGNVARLTVEFESEQVNLTKDAKGNIVEGDPSHTHIMDDEWIFERDVSSKNPNWKIIET